MPLSFRPRPSRLRLFGIALAVLAALVLLGAGGYWYWWSATNVAPSAEGRALLAQVEPQVLRDIRASRDHFTCAGIGARSFGAAGQDSYAIYLFYDDTRELLGQSGSACVGRDCSRLYPVQAVWAAQGCHEKFFAHADRKARTISLEAEVAKPEEGLVLRAAQRLEPRPARK